MPPDLQLNRFLPYRLNILSKKVSLALATRYQERVNVKPYNFSSVGLGDFPNEACGSSIDHAVPH